MKIDPKDTPAPMTLKEQRDKLLTALTQTSGALELFADWVGDGLNQNDKELILSNRQFIAQIESQIAGESKYDIMTAEGAKAKIESLGLYADIPDEPISSRVQIIHAAKRLIEALNLPDGGGVAFDRHGWWWYESQPLYDEGSRTWDDNRECEQLPRFSLTAWPGDWRDSWITRETEES